MTLTASLILTEGIVIAVLFLLVINLEGKVEAMGKSIFDILDIIKTQDESIRTIIRSVERHKD